MRPCISTSRARAASPATASHRERLSHTLASCGVALMPAVSALLLSEAIPPSSILLGGVRTPKQCAARDRPETLRLPPPSFYTNVLLDNSAVLR